MSVIVTNARNRIAYNVVRSLGQKGIDVYTADFVKRSMSFSSRYSKGRFLYPSPFTEQEAFIGALIENIKKVEAHALIPVYEETFLISKYKSTLEKHVKLAVPDYEQILTAHNKDRWSSIALDLGIPVPRSYTIAQAKAEARALNYPVLLKPRQGGGGWAITQADSSDELLRLLDHNDVNGVGQERFFAQEKINGEVVCVAMLMSHGRYRAKVAYKQLRDYPVNCGQATLRISVRNERAEANLQRLLEHLNWHGVCQADFVVDAKTAAPYLIDLNPRFWGSLAQALASGVDFPYLYYKLIMNGDVTPVEGFKTGVVTRWLGGDLRGFLPHLRASESRLGFLKDFFFPAIRASYYDDFSLADPLPFLAWTSDMLIRSLTGAGHEGLEGVWE
ncbi:MAG: ATP-grasp domain-containing protein [Deltaproteobacteria bacterium]|nr:ATP-grasp domain-containing protein [Deltaproteobacteria bacterium]